MKTTVPVNTTNAMGNKKRKRPKNVHKPKKDEENILSKDIEDDNIKYMMDTKKTLKPREDLKSSFTLKNLRFKPQKYKGSFLPYHLRWIFNNNVKTNEIVLLNEIEGLENEINRLKSIKIINRECRKIAGLPFGISTNFCQCCHLFEKKKHECSHKFCSENCPRKKAEELMMNLIKNNKLKENKENNKENSANKNQNIKSEEKITINNTNNNIDNQNKNNIVNENNNNDLNNNEIKKENNNINENEKNQINLINPPVIVPPKRRLIFGVVERPKEKKSIFMVKSDLVPENNKINNQNNKNIDISDDDKNSYTINIDSEEDLYDKIDNDKDEKDEKKEDKKEEKKEKKIRKKRKAKKDSSEHESLEEDDNEDNDNDDIIIINQTSPQSSSEFEKISDDDDD